MEGKPEAPPALSQHSWPNKAMECFEGKFPQSFLLLQVGWGRLIAHTLYSASEYLVVLTYSLLAAEGQGNSTHRPFLFVETHGDNNACMCCILSREFHFGDKQYIVYSFPKSTYSKGY